MNAANILTIQNSSPTQLAIQKSTFQHHHQIQPVNTMNYPDVLIFKEINDYNIHPQVIITKYFQINSKYIKLITQSYNKIDMLTKIYFLKMIAKLLNNNNQHPTKIIYELYKLIKSSKKLMYNLNVINILHILQSINFIKSKTFKKFITTCEEVVQDNLVTFNYQWIIAHTNQKISAMENTIRSKKYKKSEMVICSNQSNKNYSYININDKCSNQQINTPIKSNLSCNIIPIHQKPPTLIICIYGHNMINNHYYEPIKHYIFFMVNFYSKIIILFIIISLIHFMLPMMLNK